MVIQRYSVGTKYVYRQTLRLYAEFLGHKSVYKCVLVKRDPLQSRMIELARASVRREFSP